MRLGLLLLACAVAGCESNPAPPTPTPTSAPCTFTLSATTITMGAGGGAGSVAVTTGSQCHWTASSAAAWVTATGGASTTGSGTFTFSVAASADTAARTGSLTVAGQAVTVSQQGAPCTCTLVPASRSVEAAGATATFDVTTTTGCAWTASTAAAWITVLSGASGSGTGTVTFKADANAGTTPRTGTIAAGGQAFTITQAGGPAAPCDYAVAPVDVRACMSEGFVRTIAVTTGAGCPWTSSAAAPWITIASGLSGTGPGTISYTLGNNFDAARQATIEVRWPAPTAGQNVRVAQAGCGYGVSRDSFDVPAAGGDFTFDVISSSTDTSCGGPLQNGCQWSASASAPWVTVLTTMPRFGDERVLFRVAANLSGAARSAVITVRDRAVTIRQAVS